MEKYESWIGKKLWRNENGNIFFHENIFQSKVWDDGHFVHWNGNVFILMKLSSLAALEVVKMTTSSAASDENFIKMMTFSFQWGLDVTMKSTSMHTRRQIFNPNSPIKKASYNHQGQNTSWDYSWLSPLYRHHSEYYLQWITVGKLALHDQHYTALRKEGYRVMISARSECIYPGVFTNK